MASLEGRDWLQTLKAYTHPRVVTMLFLGFSAGLPLLLIFSSLSVWLREAGVDRASVTFFSWAALGYSFKFVWAPIIDRMPLPGLTRLLGRRRSWMLVAQCSILCAIVWMAMTDPADNLHAMALAAVLLGFSSATQDIVIDAYRIESAETDLQALMSATYIAGYRIGMLVTGAGALYLASLFGSGEQTYVYTAWQGSMLCMALAMLVGVITTLIIAEPKVVSEKSELFHKLEHYVRFILLFFVILSGFIATFVLLGPWLAEWGENWGSIGMIGNLLGFFLQVVRLSLSVLGGLLLGWLAVRFGIARSELLRETYVAPILDFFVRYGKPALTILLLIGVYRISDIVLGVIANVFYIDMGFTKNQIASIVKTFGLFMTILGGFLGGTLSYRFGVLSILTLGAVLAAGTNLLFMLLSVTGPSEWMLILVIAADNLSAGLASAAFVAYLSSLTNIQFTAMQYALFSSLMTLFPKLLGGYSGTMVDAIGYPSFFLFTALLGIPVIAILLVIRRWYRPALPARAR